MKFKEYLTESINDKGIMKAVILGGLSGSGKSTVVNTIITDGAFPIVTSNTDKWTDHFEGDYITHRPKIKHLTSTQLINSLNSLLPIYIDTVSGNISIFKRRVNELRNIGYDVKMVFVEIDIETSLKRLENRNKQQNRQVDPQFAIDTFNRFYCKGEFKTPGCIDNIQQYSSVLGEKPIIVKGDVLSFDKTAKKIYNKVVNFLKAPIKNKKGKLLIDFMKKNGYKYYNDVPEEWLVGHGFPKLKDIVYY